MEKTKAGLKIGGMLARKSIKLMADSQYHSGAFPASTAESHYRLCWLRDGFWVAESLAAAGHVSGATRFYSWAESVMSRHWKKLVSVPHGPRDVIHPRFTPDGAELGENWGWHQLDAVSSILFGLCKTHLSGHPTNRGLIRALARYVENAWLLFPEDHSVWEEEKAVHLSSVAPAIASLRLASRIVPVRKFVLEDMEEFVESERTKGGVFFDHPGKHADFSVLNAWSFGVVDDVGFLRTARHLERVLGREFGLIRYPGDRYFSYNGKEGQWPLGRLWLAYYWHSLWKSTGKERFFRKFAKNISMASMATTESGHFPEQVMPEGAENAYAGARLRNGRFGNAIATPLLWAHAMLVLAKTGRSILPERFRTV